MPLTIDMKPELEARLKDEAAKSGIDANTYVVHALEERLQHRNRQHTPSRLSHDEAALLQQINQGLPESVWHEYTDLITKRRAETLTSEEHTRLISLSDRIEEEHVERLTHVAELARLQNVPFTSLIKQLGIKPREV